MRVIAARSKFFYQMLKRTAPAQERTLTVRFVLYCPFGWGWLYSLVRSAEMAERSSLNDSRKLGVASNPP